MKRCFIGVMALFAGILCISQATKAAPAEHWASEQISYLAEQGIWTNEFTPDDPMTRAEAAQVLSHYVDAPADQDAFSFKDVQADNPYYDAIIAMGRLSIINGYPDGTFRPQETLTRAQASVLLNKVLRGSLSYEQEAAQYDDTVNHWAKDAIATLSESRIVGHAFGQGFSPNEQVTKAEFAIMLARVLNPSFRVAEHGSTVGNLENSGRITRQGDWIYYSPIINSVISADQSILERKHLKDGTIEHLGNIVGTDINVVDNKLYLIATTSEQPLDMSNRLYRMNVDGSDKAVYTNFKGTPSELTVVGDWLYFVEHTEQNGYLRRMKSDGSKLQTLATNVSEYVLSDPYIFYESDDAFFQIRMDGSDPTPLFTSELHLKGLAHDKFIMTNDEQVHEVALDGSSTLIFEVNKPEARWVHTVNFDDGMYYVVDWFGDLTMYRTRLFKVNVGKDPELVENVGVYDLYLFDHALYYGAKGGDGNQLLMKWNGSSSEPISKVHIYDWDNRK
ncbi:S-layer homology domain-containing protein [Aureibacillus halotolerans]|uniref:S-layer family protein n=1 Tax=Aureibacillus halotolerans TaxID=1508390 RepID=A0A4R6U566_9BACI|nr:S-layer homology domain-containing protein [Aureibacillus halotolerans]TDQ40876.1 S-layer family protein [Aureibacillus halotolerans]